MKTLYLHIGMGKTGSSALQSWLSLNATALCEQGIHYADLTPLAKRGVVTSGNGQMLWQALGKQDCDEAERLLLEEYFLKGGYDTAIVSCEHLHHLGWPKLRPFNALCQRLAITVKIICFVRSAYEHMYSAYGQRVKREGISHAFGDDPKDTESWKSSHVLATYAVYFREHMQVINYDDPTKDVFTAFAEACGIDIARMSKLDGRVNRSLNSAELDTLRLVNSLHDGTFTPALSDYLMRQFPQRDSSVHYDADLLVRVRSLLGTEIDWINREFALQPRLRSDRFTDSANSTRDADQCETWAELVQWARQYQPGAARADAFAELLASLAQQPQSFNEPRRKPLFARLPGAQARSHRKTLLARAQALRAQPGNARR